MDPSQPTDDAGPVGSITDEPDETPSDESPTVDREASATPVEAEAPAAPPAEVDGVELDTVDLDAIAADLADVERAMERLEAATYWTDEVTGAPLDDAYLAEHPTARRAGSDTSAASPPPAP